VELTTLRTGEIVLRPRDGLLMDLLAEELER
jgi:hypothetical protein